MLISPFLAGILVGLFTISTPVRASVDWEPWLDMHGQIFPSYIIATHGVDVDENDWDWVMIGDAASLLGAAIETEVRGTRVELIITSDTVMNPSRVSGVLEEPNATYGLFPVIDWKFPALLAHNQTTPLVINFELKVNGETHERKSVRATLRSINDCPFMVLVDEEEDEWSDISWMFAAYVNEDHPWIDRMLGEALDLGIVSSFSGYQSGDPNEVLAQVFAIWSILQNKGIRYSNITATAGRSDKVVAQEVRFLDESIGNRQANCVDGSVVIASFLRKIDIAPVLVMVPGHCFVGFYLDEELTTLVGIETTMLGIKVDDPSEVLQHLPEDIVFPGGDKASWAAFWAAIGVAEEQLEAGADAFDDEDDIQHQIIDINEAREMGILPIAHVPR